MDKRTIMRPKLLAIFVSCFAFSSCIGEREETTPDQRITNNPADGSARLEAHPATNDGGTVRQGDSAVYGENLVIHADGLSILMPHHIGLLKVDCEHARQSPLLCHIAELLRHDSPAQGVVEPIANTLAQLEVAWVALRPFKSDNSDLETPWTGLGYTLFLRFKGKEECDNFLLGYAKEGMSERKYKGRDYIELEYAFFSYAVRDGNNLFLSHTLDEVHHFLSGAENNCESKLYEILAGVDLSQDVVAAGLLGKLRQTVINSVTAIHDSHAEIKDLLDPLTKSLDFATLVMDFDGKTLFDLRIDMADVESARQLEEAIPGAISLAGDALAVNSDGWGVLLDDEQVAWVMALTKGILEDVQTKRNDRQVEMQLASSDKIAMVAMFILTPKKMSEPNVNEQPLMLPPSQFAGATGEAGDPDAERHPFPPSSSRVAGDPFVHYVEHVETGEDTRRSH